MLKKVADDSEDLLNSEMQSTLRVGIGKLMWHMQYSRPDVSQAVRDLARHMTRGDRSHMDAMLRCMKYMVCTKDAGLLLKPERKWDGTKNSSSSYVHDQIRTMEKTHRHVVAYQVMWCILKGHRSRIGV